jgi:hypothetical protein
MAARKTGLLHDERGLYVSDLKQIVLLNSKGTRDRLIFVGLDKDNNRIYALSGCGPRELILRFINSFISLCGKNGNNFTITDCSNSINPILSLSWYFFQKNIFGLFGEIVCHLINKSYIGASAAIKKS